MYFCKLCDARHGNLWDALEETCPCCGGYEHLVRWRELPGRRVYEYGGFWRPWRMGYRVEINKRPRLGTVAEALGWGDDR